MARKKKSESSVQQVVSVKFLLDGREVEIPWRDISIHVESQPCEVCGSHSAVRFGFLREVVGGRSYVSLTAYED
jgi:hypothetical protein